MSNLMAEGVQRKIFQNKIVALTILGYNAFTAETLFGYNFT